MPWILISKYSSLYLTPPPLCVSHAWLDWEAIRPWITTQPASCFGKSFTHPVEASYPKLCFFSSFFLAIYESTHCTFTYTNKFCVKQVSANYTRLFCSTKSDWPALLSQSEAVRYPIGAHVQVWCWQDISAGQCICSHPSSEKLSAPTLHYHNALGSVKRPAVIWKGNYLLWNLLKQT